MITMAHYDLWVWLLVCPFSEVILYSRWRSGAKVLSVVWSIEVVRISEVENTLYTGADPGTLKGGGVLRKCSLASTRGWVRDTSFWICTLVEFMEVHSLTVF